MCKNFSRQNFKVWTFAGLLFPGSYLVIFLLKIAQVRGCARISQDRASKYGPLQVFFYLEVDQ